MFKEKYKKANDSIALSEESRRIMHEKIMTGNTGRKMPWLAPAVSAVACACVIMLIALPLAKSLFAKSEPDISGTQQTPSAFRPVNDYAEVYAALKSAKQDHDLSFKGELAINEAAVDAAVAPAMPTEENMADADAPEHSETNTQIKGVDEADIIKTNGKQIYVMNQDGVSIFNVNGDKTSKIASISLNKNTSLAYYSYLGMYLYEDTLVLNTYKANYSAPFEGIMGRFYCYGADGATHTLFYDVSDPKHPKQVHDISQDGYYSESRLTEGILYIASNYYAYSAWDEVVKSKPETYIPEVCDENGKELIPFDRITLLDEPDSTYCVLTSIDMSDTSNIKNSLAILGRTDGLFASHDNILLYKNGCDSTEFKAEISGETYTALSADADTYIYVNEYSDQTELYLVSMDKGNIAVKANGKINGHIDDQFSIDEYKDHLRIVTNRNERVNSYKKVQDGLYSYNEYTTGDIHKSYTANDLYILDMELNITGSITDIAENEYVKSARFMGDVGYFVTFRQTDPLFSVDLKDPENPRIIGKLKIPGFSEYLQSYGDGLLFGLGFAADENDGGTYGIKLSMFDVSDPSNVAEVAYRELRGEYSSATYDHKAILADPGKNIIAFPGNSCYYIYSYQDGQFKLERKIRSNFEWSYNMRGVYIGDYYYVVDVENTEITVLDLKK